MQLWLDICCSWGYAPVVDKLPDLALFIWIWAIPCRNEIEPGQVRSLLLAQLCANYVCVFIETAKPNLGFCLHFAGGSPQWNNVRGSDWLKHLSSRIPRTGKYFKYY